jgi:hypothetical protein
VFYKCTCLIICLKERKTINCNPTPLKTGFVLYLGHKQKTYITSYNNDYNINQDNRHFIHGILFPYLCRCHCFPFILTIKFYLFFLLCWKCFIYWDFFFICSSICKMFENILTFNYKLIKKIKRKGIKQERERKYIVQKTKKKKHCFLHLNLHIFLKFYVLILFFFHVLVLKCRDIRKKNNRKIKGEKKESTNIFEP